jgi:hypothetical protein
MFFVPFDTTESRHLCLSDFWEFEEFQRFFTTKSTFFRGYVEVALSWQKRGVLNCRAAKFRFSVTKRSLI